ncbi:hypothetical protein [Massilia niastensis]|uniref:hypothetical protein n=1 Tax=Massilia niastensis TaxID=544911 RepID=UPI0012ECAA9D|nr:hypothetical protein [Massilia niastensis]
MASNRFRTAPRSMAAAILLLSAAATAGAHDHSYGAHGMVLFGDRDGLYASHLPLFKAPHDRQVVLQLRLADPRLDRELRARMQGATALWTIDPERFELSRLDPASASPLRAFKADIVEGHFERGGRQRHAQAQFVVEKVVYHWRLDPGLRVATTSRYLPVGKYLVKKLDSRPDFDHIVKLAQPLKEALTIERPDLSNPEAALGQRAPVVGTVYFETGDLE